MTAGAAGLALYTGEQKSMSENIYTTLTGRIDEAFRRFESFYEWLNYAVYMPLQGILNDAAKKQTCGKGCSFCCSRLVVTTRIEALALADYIFSVPGLYTGDLQKSISTHSAMVKEFLDSIDKPQEDHNLWFTRDIPCPFLKDSACSVYGGRPLSCRMYHSLEDPQNCRRPVRNVKQLQMLLDSDALFQMMIFRIAGRVEQSLATTGVLSILLNEILESGAFKKENS